MFNKEVPEEALTGPDYTAKDYGSSINVDVNIARHEIKN
jgi:hypothetical protein